MAKSKENPLVKYSKYILLAIFIPSFLLNIYLLQIYKNQNLFPSLIKTVTRVIDGDTFDVEGDTRIRLAGADAPEYPKGCLSEQAKTRLNELISGKKVRLEEVEKDNFKRTVAFVFLDDLSIDQAIVSEGLAKVTSNNDSEYSSVLLAREVEAQNANRGVWSALCRKPPTADCVIKGNTRRGVSKIYHLPECYNYEKIVIDEKDGDSWFCTEKEANNSGFRKSSDCPS